MIVDFKAFATAVDANVMTQADYQAAAFLTEGFSPGIAQSAQLNKVWRQSAFLAAALAQYVSNQTGLDVLDDGDLAGFITKLTSAIVVGSANKPARIVTASANLNVLLTDYRIGFARVAAPAALNLQLPVTPVGQSFKFGDLQGNMNAFPITVVPPGGQTFANLPGNFAMNVNRQWVEFAFMGSNTWSIEQ